ADGAVWHFLAEEFQGHEVALVVLADDHLAEQGLDPGERILHPLAGITCAARRNRYLQVVDAVAADREEVFHRVGRGRVTEGALPLATLPTEPGLKILLAVFDAVGVPLASTATSVSGSLVLRQPGSHHRFGVAPSAPRQQAVQTRPIHVKLVR